MTRAFLQRARRIFSLRQGKLGKRLTERNAMAYFWYFLFYSFFGYLLEKLFARVTQSERQVRKCFLLLPLCPVYGLAMTALLLIGAERIDNIWALMVIGTAVTTAVEYAVHWGYETLFGVYFWDYTPTKMDVNGRICIPFSIAWGLLSAAAVRLVQPELTALAANLSDEWAGAALFLLTFDSIITARVLLVYHDTELLSFPALRRRKTAEP